MLWLKIKARVLGGSVIVFFAALLVLLGVGVVAGGCRQTDSSALGSLRVHIVAPDGTGLAGAKAVSNIQPGSQLKVTGITGADGVVTIAGLRPGSYEFYVSRFDYDQKEFTVAVRGDLTTGITVTLTKTLRQGSG